MRERSIEIRGLTVAQSPNPPLAVALLALVAGWLTDGSPHDVARATFYVALTVWAWEEAANGINWFRRLLGAAALVYIVRRPGPLVALLWAPPTTEPPARQRRYASEQPRREDRLPQARPSPRVGGRPPKAPKRLPASSAERSVWICPPTATVNPDERAMWPAGRPWPRWRSVIWDSLAGPPRGHRSCGIDRRASFSCRHRGQHSDQAHRAASYWSTAVRSGAGCRFHGGPLLCARSPPERPCERHLARERQGVARPRPRRERVPRHDPPRLPVRSRARWLPAGREKRGLDHATLSRSDCPAHGAVKQRSGELVPGPFRR